MGRKALLLRVLIAETGPVTERLRVREIDDDEGRRLVRIVRRGSGSVVTWRRAQMVLLSAQGTRSTRIPAKSCTGSSASNRPSGHCSTPAPGRHRERGLDHPVGHRAPLASSPGLEPVYRPLWPSADFLTWGNGSVIAVEYGQHADGQWSVDESLGLARKERQAGEPTSTESIGSQAN
jgi:hypothetical protein